MGYDLPNEIPDDIRPTLLVPTRFCDEKRLQQTNDIDMDNASFFANRHPGFLRQSGRLVTPPAISSPLADDDSNNPESFDAIAGRAFVSPLWAAGFSFSDSSVIVDVPYDPYLPFLFFGEEVSIAARLFTHGYDFFAPPEAVVYHLWSRKHRKLFTDVKRSGRAADKAMSEAKVQLMLHSSNDDLYSSSKYGLGLLRSISDFETSCGVRFADGFIDPAAKFARLPPYLFVGSASATSVDGDGDDDLIDERGQVTTTVTVNETGCSNDATMLAALDLVQDFLMKPRQLY